MAVAVPGWFMDMATRIDSGLAAVLAAIAKYESGYDPNAVGDGGCSIGLLQMNTCGGLGQGHSISALKDPEYNLRLGASYIRGRLNQGDTLWDAMQPWSVRPSAWALLQQMQAEGIEGYGEVPPGPVNPGGPKVNPWLWLGIGLVALVLLD